MLHRVVVPFPCSWDGVTLVDLAVGDERDFGSMASGLMGMGWIVPVEAAASIADTPVEFSVTSDVRPAPKKRGKAVK